LASKDLVFEIEYSGRGQIQKLSDDVVVCSDIYTEHVGWIEGGLLSAQAGSAHLAHLM
jgi:hypothetical protein